MQPQPISPFVRLSAELGNSDSLFFESRLSEEQIHATCREIGHPFRSRIFSPAITVWMFLGQVLSADHSCRDAVSRLNVWRIARNKKPCDPDTASYCEARKRLPEPLLLELVRSTGKDCVDKAIKPWLWMGRAVKLVDGTTVTMPDTRANQAAYPQSTTQAPGVGFPIARLVAIFSLSVGAVLEVAIGKYAGKQTGETSLLRTLLSTILPGEIVLADRYYASYWMFAVAWRQGFDLVAKSHQLRKVDFRKGLKLGYLDQLVAYRKPREKPTGMSAEEYAALPEVVLVRHLRYRVTQNGFRTKEVTIATTLVDPEIYPSEAIADLYRQRWTVEIHIRSVKTHLQMDHLRCKSPSMVRKEIYAHFLAYNIIRDTMIRSALATNKNPTQLSFKGAVQAMNAFLSAVTACGTNLNNQYAGMLRIIAEHEIGDRPNRIEPRLVKKRAKPYKLLQEPRWKARNRAA